MRIKILGRLLLMRDNLLEVSGSIKYVLKIRTF